jgi:CRP-like cAMP-binding protein
MPIDMNYKKNLINFFTTNFSILKENSSTLNQLVNSFEKREVKKKTLLLKDKKIEQELRFINKGLVREYYFTGEKEVNINFYEDSDFITDFLSFHTNYPSKKYQECLTDVELLVLSKPKVAHFFGQYDQTTVLIESYFKKILRNNEKREYNIITKSPDELYKDIRLRHPNWLQKIPQYHIASYLRVTPETLSRIRKRIS